MEILVNNYEINMYVYLFVNGILIYLFKLVWLYN